jgi:ribonuclease HII
MARLLKKKMYLLLYTQIDHHLGPLAVRTGKSWRRSKQAADQRTLCVDLASINAKVWTAEIG